MNRLIKLITIVIILALNFNLKAQVNNDLHRCYLLPISDELQGTIGDELFRQTESLLQNNQWCEYLSDPKLHQLLKKYQINLNEALSTNEVLKLIAAKSKAGSIIRINTSFQKQALRLTIDILDSAGRDFLYRQSYDLEDDSLEKVMENISVSMQEYAHDLPYQGVVKEGIENDLIIKVIGETTMRVGDRVRVERAIMPKKHPLLKKVVEWQTEAIGEGLVHSTYPSFIRVRLEGDFKKAKIGDWARLIESAPIAKPKVIEPYKRTVAKLYELTGKLDFLSPYASNNLDGESEKIQSKIFMGIEGIGHLRLTPEFWTELTLNSHFGLAGSASSCQSTSALLKLGYRYHPLKQKQSEFVAPYIGYESTSYDYNSDDTLQFGPTDFTSYLFGLVGHYPLFERYSIISEMNFSLSSKAKTEVSDLSKSSRAKSGFFSLGLRYQWDEQYELTGGLSYKKNQANFDQDELSFSTVKLFSGIIYKY